MPPSFLTQKQIGVGGYGTVYQALKIKDNTVWAIKYQSFNSLYLFNRSILLELDLLTKVKHQPSFVAFENVIINKHSIGIVLELMDLNLKALYKKKDIYSLIPKLVTDISSALYCLKLLGYSHGDIKSDNILFKADKFKLADFSLSQPTFCEKQKILYCVYYRPPEFFFEKIPSDLHSADIWAFGITIWETLTRSHPLKPKTDKEIKNMMLEIKDEGGIDVIAGSFSLLISQMLRYYPFERPSAKDILKYFKQEKPKLEIKQIKYYKDFTEAEPGLVLILNFPNYLTTFLNDQTLHKLFKKKWDKTLMLAAELYLRLKKEDDDDFRSISCFCLASIYFFNSNEWDLLKLAQYMGFIYNLDFAKKIKNVMINVLKELNFQLTSKPLIPKKKRLCELSPKEFFSLVC